MFGEGLQNKMTIRESLKLDMKQPENRYAVIVDYFERNPQRPITTNNLYLEEVMKAIYQSNNKAQNALDLFSSEVHDYLSRGRLPPADLMFGFILPKIEEVLPALPLLRSERQKQGETK